VLEATWTLHSGALLANRTMKDNSRRLFVDLIKDASEYFGNWSPNQVIRVGDYGVLNKTGEFEKGGSIYDSKFAPDLNIGQKHPVQPCVQEDQHIVLSRGCEGRGFEADFSIHHPEIIKSTIKGRWSFSRGRGAVLFLHKPTELIIKDKEMLLPHLQFNKTLEDKALVTSVYTCPMFAMLLTNNRDKTAEAAIGLSVLEGTGTAGLKGNWHHYSTSGVWKSGGQEGDSIFHPLYALRTPKTRSWLAKWLGRRGEPEGGDTFLPYQPPWDVLDEDGNEVTTDLGEAEQLEQEDELDLL